MPSYRPPSEQEQFALKDQLTRYTVPAPEPSVRIKLLARMKEELQLSANPSLITAAEGMGQSGSTGENHKAAANPGWLDMFARQFRVLTIRYWVASLLLFGLGMVVMIVWSQIANNPGREFLLPMTNGLNPFILIMPLMSAAGIVYALRSLRTPMFELEMSMPSSMTQIIISRFVIIAAYNILLGFMTSFPMSVIFDLDVLPFVISWASPALLYGVISLLAVMRLGVWTGSLFTAAVWLVPILYGDQLRYLNVMSSPGDEHWMISKAAALLLTLLLVFIAVIMARRPNLPKLRGDGGWG